MLAKLKIEYDYNRQSRDLLYKCNTAMYKHDTLSWSTILPFLFNSFVHH